MPFPDIQVLNRFLNDYIEIRTPTWHSLRATVTKGAHQFLNTSTQVVYDLAAAVFQRSKTATHEEEKPKTESDEEKITNVCTALKTAFAEAKTLKAWTAVICDLGIQARLAQEQRDRNSLFCQTLHAMRSYAVQEVQQLPEFKDEIAKLVTALEEKKLAIRKEKKAGRLVDTLVAEKEKILYQLADLGDEDTIFDGEELGIFRQLVYPGKKSLNQLALSQVLIDPSLNIHKPLYYQNNWFGRYHENRIRHIKPKEDFEAFKLRAKEKLRKDRRLVVTTEEAAAVQTAAQKRPESDDEVTSSPKGKPQGKSGDSPSQNFAPSDSAAAQAATTPGAESKNNGGLNTVASPPPLAAALPTSVNQTNDGSDPAHTVGSKPKPLDDKPAQAATAVGDESKNNKDGLNIVAPTPSLAIVLTTSASQADVGRLPSGPVPTLGSTPKLDGVATQAVVAASPPAPLASSLPKQQDHAEVPSDSSDSEEEHEAADEATRPEASKEKAERKTEAPRADTWAGAFAKKLAQKPDVNANKSQASSGKPSGSPPANARPLGIGVFTPADAGSGKQKKKKNQHQGQAAQIAPQKSSAAKPTEARR